MSNSANIKKILFVGPLDYPNVPTNGDSVKNQHLVNFLQKHRYVRYIDTWNLKRKPWKLLQLLWLSLFGNYDSIVYSISNQSAYHLTRILTKLPIKKKLIYSMIGGYTPIRIINGEFNAELFRKVDKIIVEADRVSEFYRSVGIHNTLRVYNFKPYTYIPDLNQKHIGKIKFVFLSRLTKLKGVFLILDAVKKINAMGYDDKFEVDYYGVIESEIKEEFIGRLAECKNVQYKGFLNLKDESNYEILSQYDAMLFPTMHPTEGFPGVIADAAIAGVPVIAANWNYAEELVGDCGYIIPVGDLQALLVQMIYVIEHRDENEDLRKLCVERAKHYHIENVLTEDLLEQIGI